MRRATVVGPKCNSPSLDFSLRACPGHPRASWNPQLKLENSPPQHPDFEMVTSDSLQMAWSYVFHLSDFLWMV
jgi:hypothetical protein